MHDQQYLIKPTSISRTSESQEQICTTFIRWQDPDPSMTLIQENKYTIVAITSARSRSEHVPPRTHDVGYPVGGAVPSLDPIALPVCDPLRINCMGIQ